MKKYVMLFLLFSAFVGSCFAEETAENHIDLSIYASTRGEIQVNFTPQWKFPFFQGNSPLTSENNIILRLDADLSPIGTALSGDAILTVFPFLLLSNGAMAGTGWNYNLFGKFPLVGLGLNKRVNADDQNDGVIGNGFDGVVWNVHAGATVQFDLGAFFPGDWNHIVMQFYNRVEYFAYSKAKNNDLWYYLDDDGMNMNAFLHKFEFFAGYAMPIFVDLIGYQLKGALPFYNVETGGSIRERGYYLNNALIVNFKISEQFSIMTLANVDNKLKIPITSIYEREWKFDRFQVIATWRLK